MPTSGQYQNLTLETVNDYKFFASLVGEKLRNTNFKPQWREVFMKTLLQQMTQFTTLKSYQKIDKIFQDVGRQRHEQQLEAKRQQQLARNIKEKKLVSLKLDKGAAKAKKIAVEEEGDIISDSDDSNY